MAVWTKDWNPVENIRQPVIQLESNDTEFRALVAPWDACIQDANAGPGVCLRPPRDGSQYEYAHVAGVQALIPAGLGHADPTFGISAAQDVYANTDLAVLGATYSEDDLGIWAAGDVIPGLTEKQLFVTRRGGLSGDWRWVEEEQRHRMIASQLVNTVGFRKANGRRQYAMTASAFLVPNRSIDIPNALFSMPDGMAMISAAHEPDTRTSIMVALVPDDGSYSELELPHVTMVYAGSVGDEGQPDIGEIHAVTTALAEMYEPFTAARSGAGELGSEGAHIMLLEAPEMDAIRAELQQFNRSEHTGWINHSTIRYADADDPLPRARDLPETLRFSNLIVAVGDEITDHPLGSRPSVMASLVEALKNR